MEAGNTVQGASASRRNGKYTQILCVVLLVIILLGLLIGAITILVAFKYAEGPQFVVKNIEVSAFRVVKLEPPVLSTNIDVVFDSDNENCLVGVEFWNVVMETAWFEVGAKFKGTHQVQHFAQGSKSTSNLMMSAQGEIQISKSSLRKEDVKLDFILRGELNFYSGFLLSVRRNFTVLCNGISIVSSNATTCDTNLFSTKRW